MFGFIVFVISVLFFHPLGWIFMCFLALGRAQYNDRNRDDDLHLS
jgi:hypothetical protein